MTASALLSDGTIKSGSAAFTYGTAVAFYNDSALDLGMNAAGQFVLSIRSTQTIRAVKLELGTVSTLANDAPPDYEEELKKCKQYYREWISTSGYPLGIGWEFANTGATLINVFGIGNEMRAQPNVAFSGEFLLRTVGGTNIAVTNITKATGGSALSLDFAVSGGLTINQPCRIFGNAGAKIIFSADL